MKPEPAFAPKPGSTNPATARQGTSLRRVGWVLGWAIPREWFAALVASLLPNAEHILVDPDARTFELLEAQAPYDVLVGYSLGSLLLLREAPRANALTPRVELLAPIFSFCREANLGGRVPRANLRALAKLLARDPAQALAAFYATAQLKGQVWDPRVLPADALLWGLQQLDHSSVPAMLPDGWGACVGANDSLLDAARLQEIVPSLRILPHATHHPRDLVASLA